MDHNRQMFDSLEKLLYGDNVIPIEIIRQLEEELGKDFRFYY